MKSWFFSVCIFFLPSISYLARGLCWSPTVKVKSSYSVLRSSSELNIDQDYSNHLRQYQTRGNVLKKIFNHIPIFGASNIASAVAPVISDITNSGDGKDTVSPLENLTLPYNGKDILVKRLLGSKATLVINVKLDDPISLQQMPEIVSIFKRFGREGLHIILVPTDQGYFEPDEDRVVKIKFFQFYGFGQYPVATVLDKIDIVGNNAHPFYKYICRRLKNPYGIGRITLNYEKFLLDGNGVPLRRYPRQLPLSAFIEDITAAVREEQLPPPSKQYSNAWTKAKKEAQTNEYAFKFGMNYYNSG